MLWLKLQTYCSAAFFNTRRAPHLDISQKKQFHMFMKSCFCFVTPT